MVSVGKSCANIIHNNNILCEVGKSFHVEVKFGKIPRFFPIRDIFLAWSSSPGKEAVHPDLTITPSESLLSGRSYRHVSYVLPLSLCRHLPQRQQQPWQRSSERTLPSSNDHPPSESLLSQAATPAPSLQSMPPFSQTGCTLTQQALLYGWRNALYPASLISCTRAKTGE